MIEAITALLLCQLAGEALVRMASLPIPGPVAGLLIMFVVLTVRGRIESPLEETANGILANLSLLFVPAGVGVIQHLPRIRAEWLAIGAALVLSTLLTLAVTAIVFTLVARLIGAEVTEVEEEAGRGVGEGGL